MSRGATRNVAPNREAPLIVATKEGRTTDATGSRAATLGAARRGGIVGAPRSAGPPGRHRGSNVDGKGPPTALSDGLARQGDQRHRAMNQTGCDGSGRDLRLLRHAGALAGSRRLQLRRGPLGPWIRPVRRGGRGVLRPLRRGGALRPFSGRGEI